ncbi:MULTISPECIES: glycosyltransferase family 4 protein [unclassified Facklamia]|uniref:glycosyltransferase family 4 protein n=1 Tax=Aerococcaceae TaxID=186827 RepID=UPI0013BD63BE|nr:MULTISPECIES: glycosyltransferase family 4 protein [unclassified Facklamia]MBS4462470.1 hypothetical protein [Aerococcaceae bacterium zg-B36]NEW65057.1 hypothetical protein [Facklamia sp. 252]NEW68714.1 hypothetical protein [Facklamia sp. 253]QQD65121.1 hypothetical protein JDW14_07345 [Aerococcaceae bacterium zg-252]
MKNNLLIINSGYPPLKSYGGPSVSIENFVKNLSGEYNITVFTNSKEINGHENKNIKKYILIKGKYNENIYCLDKENFNFIFLNDKINSKFNLVYVNSFFNIRLMSIGLQYALNQKIPLLIAPRGELEENALKIKKIKKSLYLTLYNFLVFFFKIPIYYQATSESEFSNIQKNKCK